MKVFPRYQRLVVGRKYKRNDKKTFLHYQEKFCLYEVIAGTNATNI